MEILVCVKRVPDTAENEIEVNSDGTDIERDDLVYSVNEWDNYAVEEAIQIKDRVGGSVTVITVGDDQSEEVLRREMAKEAGADVIVTGCPFCLVNMEDAIKVAGLEGQMEAIDLSELAARQIQVA